MAFLFGMLFALYLIGAVATLISGILGVNLSYSARTPKSARYLWAFTSAVFWPLTVAVRVAQEHRKPRRRTTGTARQPVADGWD